MPETLLPQNPCFTFSFARISPLPRGVHPPTAVKVCPRRLCLRIIVFPLVLRAFCHSLGGGLPSHSQMRFEAPPHLSIEYFAFHSGGVLRQDIYYNNIHYLGSLASIIVFNTIQHNSIFKGNKDKFI